MGFLSHYHKRLDSKTIWYFSLHCLHKLKICFSAAHFVSYILNHERILHYPDSLCFHFVYIIQILVSPSFELQNQQHNSNIFVLDIILCDSVHFQSFTNRTQFLTSLLTPFQYQFKFQIATYCMYFTNWLRFHTYYVILYPKWIFSF